MKILPYLSFCLFLLLSACSHSSKYDWESIDRLICSSPKDGLLELEKISTSDFTKADKQRYNLLTIKALDKLYVTHTTDSIILDIIEYYSRYNKQLYPEALYYGGRVYSDLGDKPTAIKYYQSALDLLTDKTHNFDLLSNILSQIAQECLYLNLNDEAMLYLKEVVKCDSIKNDSINLAFDFGMFGEIYQRKNKPDKAKEYYQMGLKYLSENHRIHQASLIVSLANVQLQKRNIDSAKILINQIVKETARFDTSNAELWDLRNTALSTAVQTYYKIGDYHTAHIYAKELAISNNPLNRQNGFYFLFKPELIKDIPADSLIHYITEYHKTLENRYNKHDIQQVTMQNSQYNYEIHERERLKAELKEHKTLIFLAIAIIVALIMLIATLYYRYREKNKLIELHNVVEDLQKIKEHLNIDFIPNCKSENNTKPQNLIEIKENLLNSIIIDTEKQPINEVPFEITMSPAYVQIKNRVENNQAITPNDDLWNQAIELINNCQPNFINRIRFLSNGKISPNDTMLAVLIKFGFTPGQIAILLNYKKNALSYHRKMLCKLISNGLLDTAKLDNLIKHI